jgi:nucleoside 2-deoxyribosyltransferase
MRYVYLAGPIAGCDQEEAKDWRADVTFRLPPGIVAINPLRSEPTPEAGPYKLTYQCHKFGTAGAIAAKNRYDVKKCDLILAHLPRDINERRPSYGTIFEIAWAVEMQKPIIVWTDDEYIREHPLVKFYVPWFVDNMDDAIDIISGLLSVYTKKPGSV